MNNIQNRFVCPVPSFLRGRLLHFNRLYAFPVLPEPVGNADFIILDSGGYSLWKQGRVMSESYIARLAAHYRQYAGSNIYCAAPDVSQDYKATIENTIYYLKKYDSNICPIIHFADHRFNFSQLKYQVAAYKELFSTCPFVFWGGTMAKAALMLNSALRFKLDYVRQELQTSWIHFLGAGWGSAEVQQLAAFDSNISFDSLAYYNCSTDAAWTLNDWGNYYQNDKVKTSIANAETANNITRINSIQ